MIQDKPGGHKLPGTQLTVDNLKRSIGSRWINDAIVSHMADLINLSCKDTYPVYLNFEPDLPHLAEKIKGKFNDRLPRKVVIALNVGMEGNKTFLGDCYDQRGNTKGSHFSFAVYFTETNVLYYGDSLGWPVPERFIHIMHNLIDNIRGDTRTTPMTICPLHSNINAQDDIDIELFRALLVFLSFPI